MSSGADDDPGGLVGQMSELYVRRIRRRAPVTAEQLRASSLHLGYLEPNGSRNIHSDTTPSPQNPRSSAPLQTDVFDEASLSRPESRTGSRPGSRTGSPLRKFDERRALTPVNENVRRPIARPAARWLPPPPPPAAAASDPVDSYFLPVSRPASPTGGARKLLLMQHVYRRRTLSGGCGY